MRSWTISTILFLASGLFAGCEASAVTAIHDVTIIGGRGVAEGLFQQPRAIEALPIDGSVVVIDRSGRIQRFAADGKFSIQWRLPEWSEGQPVDCTLSPWGTILVGDTHYRRILEFDLDGKELRRFGEEADLELVRGVVAADSGLIFVADYGEKDRIHRFRRDGTYLGFFGRRGEGPGEFLRPEGLTLGASGDLFAVDCGHHRVLRFTQEGEFVSAVGGPGTEPGSFQFPFDIATGSNGSLYVVDFRGNRVQKFLEDGTLLGAVGGPGRTPGRFSTPRGIAVIRQPEGDLVFVADTYNHRVQRFRWEYDR